MLRERKAMRKAKLYVMETENIEGEIKQTGKTINKQVRLRLEI
jgi:hypothetical protein